jgi:hypothetical protein
MLNRWLYFLVAILFGVIAGVLLGWFVLPAENNDTSPDVLRVDFRSDYVLMVAEMYAREGDLSKAISRLAFLGSTSPEEIVQAALFFAEPRYADADLNLMRGLLQVLQSQAPGAGGVP